MPTLARFALVTTLAVAPLSLANAQAPAQTGTGGGPLSTERASNVTATGQTKPPGRADAPSEAGAQKTRNDVEQDKLTKGICIGCAPK